MARPKDADSGATYEAIVAAARSVLSELPNPAALSLRRVATKAGLSVGTISYYFGSREGLLEACLDEYYHDLGRLAVDLATLGEEREGRAFVEEATRRAFTFVRSERALTHLRRTTSATRGELHPTRQGTFLGSALDRAARLLRPHTEVTFEECRLAIQSMAVLVARFALLTDSEIAHLFGEEGHEAVERWVVRAARRLVRPGDG